MNQTLINKIYPGKVLLFGEYTAIHGGDSLALPFYKKMACWDYDDLEFESRESLDKFFDYIIVQGISELDIDRFSKEWEQGLFLDSNIPLGYGCGSSGSVVAAVYDAFVSKKIDDVSELRNIFSAMESYFHGSSSGLDPLVSYLGKGIHVEDQKVSIVDSDFSLLSSLYLWDSGVSRKTSPLVEWYKEHQLKGLQHHIEDELTPINRNLIQYFMSSDETQFAHVFQRVEQFQLNYFKPMFPRIIKEQLLQLKATYDIYFKLCGAGGGGYYLIHSKDPAIKNEKGIIPLH